MTIVVRQPFAVYIFPTEGEKLVGKTFARFSNKAEAESFCRAWQTHDPVNLYAVTEECP